MGEDLLADALAQAKNADIEVRAAALMRIARVQLKTAPEDARRTFEQGLDAARQLPPRQGNPLMSTARLVAAVVAPDLLDKIPSWDRARHHFEADRLARTMLDHGFIDRAADYVLAYQGDSGSFPFGVTGMLLYRLNDDGQKARLMRHAVQAWRASAEPHSLFLPAFQQNWKVLPAGEARDVLHEIVRQTLENPEFSSQGTYDQEGKVRIDSGRENTFFQLLHVLRRLDPDLTERLIADHGQLAAAAIRFPNGMESVQQEAQERVRRSGAACGSGGGYIISGSRDDMPYLKSMVAASRTGEFEAPLLHAMERFQRDAAPGDPNEALREFWPSTAQFRSILYRAGQRLGAGAAELLERVPDSGLRLFASIELAAVLAGLPELPGMQMESHPSRRRVAVSDVEQQRPPETERGSRRGSDEPRIRCPKCQWTPSAEDRWSCKCGFLWNTFDTGGVCPRCMFQWRITQCLRCLEMSPHSDWYTHPR